MIDKIVQMSVREYESLQRAARLKEKQIQQEALKLWKEKGVATIRISVKCNDNSHLDDEYEIDCSSFVWCKDERFIIQQPLRSRIQDIIMNSTQDMIDNYVGEPIAIRNRFVKKERKLIAQACYLWLIAASGWAVAAVLFCNL